MKVLLIIILLLFNLEGEKNILQQNTDKVSKLFIKRINRLKIVEDKKKEINKNSKIKSFDYYVKEKPNRINKYYWIQVGKTNQYRFEVYFNFYCYKKTGVIRLYNTNTDSLIIVK
jgi:hypothetical protein